MTRNGVLASREAGALFRRCRQALGLSTAGMARALLVSDGRTIRRWEAGDRAVPGPAWVAMGFLLRQAGEDALSEEVAMRYREISY